MLAYRLLLCGLLAGQSAGVANLDFSAGTLAGWEGEGFLVHVASGEDPRNAYSVQSNNSAIQGQRALLHRAFVVPAGTAIIRFRACAIRGKDRVADDQLEVLLLAAGKRVIPKRVRTQQGWRTSTLLSPENGQWREYIWPVEAYAGKWVRIALVDDDDRPGCYLRSSGFELLTQEEFEAAEFRDDLVALAGRNKLSPMHPFRTPHFTAMSNADDVFSQSRLKLCETMYGVFYEHFRRKNFTLDTPAAKLQVSMFDSPSGFEAYLGRKMPPEVTGIYQLRSNRFVLYDYGQSDIFLSSKQKALRNSQRFDLQIDRLRYLDDVQRRARDIRADANTATIMHEVSHQLSFNCGLLNRQGDVPLWLAEGLACYCEATANGSWEGIGELNQPRLATLVDANRTKQRLMTLKEVLEKDDWARSSDIKIVLLGYAQSWALFRMLMQEEPQRLRAYLKLIYAERVADRRLADFQQVFGNDLRRLQDRYSAYLKELMAQFVPPKQ